jgi:hypothetical protein
MGAFPTPAPGSLAGFRLELFSFFATRASVVVLG